MNENQKVHEQFEKDAKLILKHAVDHNVPLEWYFHHLQGYVVRKTENLHSDIDFLIPKGKSAKEWYEKRIEEYQRRMKIFGVEKDGKDD